MKGGFAAYDREDIAFIRQVFAEEKLDEQPEDRDQIRRAYNFI